MSMTTIMQKNWQDLIKPAKLEIEPGRDSSRTATMVAEPLERGFGMTLGNALRRVLLSSLQGAAIKTVQIDGVQHEFYSVAGVREDVTHVVLNLKEVALRLHSEGPKRMVLRKEGPGPVLAGDIETGSEVDILNPEHVICHLDQGASIRMELTADLGKGYVLADRNRPDDAPIGLIPIDSLYSPVKKVSYKVEHTREGQDLDKDKLTIQIETDGSITPEDAGRACRAHSSGSAFGVHQLRRAQEAGRRAAPSGAVVQCRVAQESRRTGTVGAFGQLLEER